MSKYVAVVTLMWVTSLLPAKPQTIVERFKPPVGYTYQRSHEGSFADWLQKTKLKPAGSRTLTYTGNVARTDAYTAAVLNINISQYQQCADAAIRLRGEYLFYKKDYRSISFNFTSGFKCDFVHFAEGYRYQNEKWVLKAGKDYSYANFIRYLNLVFSYAGTLSLDKELTEVTSITDLQAGDVFIKGGSPGHCFIVMAVTQNARHQKKFLLAQSFIPAQNIQVLQNGSPWFSLDAPANIPYEDLIDIKYLKRFE